MMRILSFSLKFPGVTYKRAHVVDYFACFVDAKIELNGIEMGCS